MAVALETRIEGIETLVRRIDTVADRASDLSGAWGAVGRWYGQRSQAVFVKGSKSWAPLTPSYHKRKRRSGFLSRGIGVRYGMLRQHSTEDAPDVAEPTYALFGLTRADPKMIQERGGYLKKGRTSMRARNVVPALTGSERREVLRIITEHLLEE